MSTYTIAAIPTLYKGRQYRSRLEAKWAAFFDLLGWEHEYEPFDLGAWSPDFLLKPIGRSWAGSLLVEVKPISDFSHEVADKMAVAARNRPYVRLLLVGTNPKSVSNDPWEGDRCQIGWVGVERADGSGHDWSHASLLWFPHRDHPAFYADIPLNDGCHFGSRGALSGKVACASADSDTRRYPQHAADLWAKASNAVQWLGKRAQP